MYQRLKNIFQKCFMTMTFFNSPQYILFEEDSFLDFVLYKEEYIKKHNVKLIADRRNIPHKLLNEYWNSASTDLSFNYNKLFIKSLLNICGGTYDISNQEVANILDSERKNSP